MNSNNSRIEISLPRRTLRRKLCAWLVIIVYLYQPLLALGDVVADPNAGAYKPTVDSTPKGVPLVNITTPSTAGISRNQYTEFSTDNKGVVLNNNANSAPVSTSQGEILKQNGNLANGIAAKVILNEVTSTRRSDLQGNIEVAGSKADVVLANPNGITCNGCGFINTNRGVLTTGQPVFGGQGSLDAFKVTGGDILVEGNGLNSAQSARTDLISRVLTLHGPIWAQNLNAIIGSNQVNYADLGVTAIGGNGNAPAIGIDVGALGGMYAGKISLISNEAGVGVNNAGEIGASVSDLTIDSSGKVQSAGNLSATGNLSANAAGLDLSGNVSGKGNVDLQSNIDAQLSGNVFAGGNVNVHAQHLTQTSTGSVTAQQGDINLQADSDLQQKGSVETKQGSVTLQGNGIQQQGQIKAATTLSLNSSANLHNSGNLVSSGDMKLSSSGDLQNSGGLGGDSNISLGASGTITNSGNISAKNTLGIDSNADVNNQGSASSGNLYGGQQVTVNASGDLNNSASILSDGNLAITAATLNNGSASNGDSGIYATAGNVAVQAKSGINNFGTIYAKHDVLLNAANDNVAIRNAASATIQADRSVSLGADCNMDGNGNCTRNDYSSVSGISVDNRGNINSGQSLNVQADNFTNSINDPGLNGVSTQSSAPKVEQGDTGRYTNGLIVNDRLGGWYVVFTNDFFVDWKNDWHVDYLFKTPVSTDPTSMIAGTDMNILTNNGTNIGGTLAASGNMTIGGLNVANASFTNKALVETRYDYEQLGYDLYHCHWYDIACLGSRGNFQNSYTTSFQQTNSTNLSAPRGGVIQAGGTNGQGGKLTLHNLDSVSQISINRARKSVNVSTTPGSTPPDAPVVGSLPTGNNGLFVQNSSPEVHYLYISNPKLKRDIHDALSTDYLLSKLDVDGDSVMRLGDGLYEQRLLEDQILHQTGRAWLDNATSVNQEFSTLMDNGFSTAQNLGLKLGQPLTQDQVSHLDHDMVWLTETTVNGVKALVPQLYLCPATKAAASGGQMLAQSMVIDVNHFSNQGGDVIAQGNASIATKGNLENNAGTIKADNLSLTSTEGKIINRALVTRQGSDENYHDEATQGSISATHNLQINGDQGVDIIGSNVSAGDRASLQSANGDINIRSLALETKSTQREHQAGFFYSHDSVTTTTRQDKLAASVTVGADKNSAANLTMNAGKGSVNLTGAELASSGDVAINAKDIHATTLQLQQHHSEHSSSSGIYGSDGAINIGSSSHDLQEDATIASGSTIKAGGGLNLNAQHDIQLQGGNYNGASGSIQAGHDLITEAAKNKYHMTESASSAGIVMNTGSDKGKHSVGIAAGASSSHQTDDATHYSNGQLAFTGNANINAGHTADIGGIDAKAGDDANLSINANNITSTKFQNTDDRTSANQSTYLGVNLQQDSNSVGASIGFDDNRHHDHLQQTSDNINTLSGGNVSLNSNTDISLKGVNIDANDQANLTAKGNIKLDAADSSQHYQADGSSVHIGLNLAASADPSATLKNLLNGNGVSASTEDSAGTSQTGSSISANHLQLKAGNKVTLVGGDYAANKIDVNANNVDVVATRSTSTQHKTNTGVSFVADGSAAIGGNEVYGSYDSFSGKAESGTSHSDGTADRTGDGRLNNGKAISDELATSKVGLSITHHTEDTHSTHYDNANLIANNITIDTTAKATGGKNDGQVDIGGANLLAFNDPATGTTAKDSSINITTGTLSSTKYVDTTESTVHDNSTFVGVSKEVHSAVADAYNHSKTLADKANQGMDVDAGWTAAQAAGDASNLAFGDLAGASSSLTLRNTDAVSHSVATSDNTHYINANKINITTTKGDMTLNGVTFNAPPSSDSSDKKDTRPAQINLSAARNLNINAAKSTYSETSTTLDNNVSATVSGSVTAMGGGVNADVGYNGSRETDSLQQTQYQNSSLNADNVTIKANNAVLNGANVNGKNVNVDVAHNLTVTSLQDTQQQSTSRSNYGGSVGAGIGSMGIVPNVNGQGGGGNSHDNYALTHQQSGIHAEHSLALNTGGDVNLTGAAISVDHGGKGKVNIKGNMNASALQDSHDKDGLFYGGGGGLDASGINANVNLEKVDQIHYKATQSATIAVSDLNVQGNRNGNLNTDANKAAVVTEDRKVAGVFVNGTGYAPRHKQPKYDSAVAVITRDKNGKIDKTVQDAANAIKRKHPKTVVVIKDHQGDGFTYQDPKGSKLNSVKGKTRIDVIGHGDDLREVGAKSVANIVNKIATKIDNNPHKTRVARAEIVACGKCAKKGEQTLGEQVTQYLNREGLTVTEHDSDIQVLPDGRRIAYTPSRSKPQKLKHEIRNGAVHTVSRQEHTISTTPLKLALGPKDGARRKGKSGDNHDNNDNNGKKRLSTSEGRRTSKRLSLARNNSGSYDKIRADAYQGLVPAAKIHRILKKRQFKPVLSFVQFGGAEGSYAGDAAVMSLQGSRRLMSIDAGKSKSAQNRAARSHRILERTRAFENMNEREDEGYDSDGWSSEDEDHASPSQPPTSSSVSRGVTKSSSKEIGIITHGHADHYGDAADWMNADKVFVGQSKPPVEVTENTTEVSADANLVKTWVRTSNTDSAHLKVTTTAIVPDRRSKTLDANKLSLGELVTLTKSGRANGKKGRPKIEEDVQYTMLSLGDMEGSGAANAVDKAVREHITETGTGINYLKIPHHGSENNVDVAETLLKIPGAITAKTTIVISGTTFGDPTALSKFIKNVKSHINEGNDGELITPKVFFLIQDKKLADELTSDKRDAYFSRIKTSTTNNPSLSSLGVRIARDYHLYADENGEVVEFPVGWDISDSTQMSDSEDSDQE